MYKLKLHKNLDASRWCTFPQSQQILMIANEINRAKNWIKRGDSKEVKNSYERAFELLDLTISITNEKNRLKELLRFRELLGAQYIAKKNDININKKLFEVLVSLDKNSYASLNHQSNPIRDQ